MSSASDLNDIVTMCDAVEPFAAQGASVFSLDVERVTLDQRLIQRKQNVCEQLSIED